MKKMGEGENKANFNDCPIGREMSKKMERIEAVTTYLKEGFDDMKNSLENFINKADDKYATKSDIINLQNQIKDLKSDNVWTKDKIFSIAKDVAILMGIVYVGYKMNGGV